MNGLFILLQQLFTVGDTIKVGLVEGEVIGRGFTTISILNAEKFLMVVLNSDSHSKAIINKSQVGWWDIESKILVQVDDGKIQHISEAIRGTIMSHANVS